MDDERAAEGVEHLQAAALEMIAAARAFLDVAEGIVSDRDKIGDIAATVTTVAEAAVRAGRNSRSGARAGSHGASSDAWRGPEAARPPRVQHIDVS